MKMFKQDIIKNIAIKILLIFLITNSIFARADVLSESKKFESFFNQNKQAQRATLENITTRSYGMCVPLVGIVALSEIQGTKFPHETIVLVGFMQAALAYYRRAKLSAGLPQAVLDDAAAPYFQEFKIDMNGAYQRYSNQCLTLGDKILSDWNPQNPSSSNSPPITSNKSTDTFSPSFDCLKANSVTEKLICSSQNLSKRDSELYVLYKQARAKALDKDDFKKITLEAWKRREGTCKDEECLNKWYDERFQYYSKLINK